MEDQNQEFAENGDIVQLNGVQHGQNGQETMPLSTSQRRRSDIKVYKEFCDFYVR